VAIRVLLQPATVRVTPGGGSAAYTVVTGVTISLTSRGRGAAPVQATPTPASLEFYELPVQGDTARTARLLGTLAGAIRLDGTDFKFAGGAPPLIQFAPLVDETDFFVPLTYDRTNFENVTDQHLWLPWESVAERGRLELGVKLRIDSAVHADLANNDTLDVSLVHRGVPDDGTDTAQRFDCQGITEVYPTGNHNLTTAQRIPISSDPLRIRVHDSVRDACNAVHAGSFNLAQLTTHLTTIFRDAGFATVDVQLKSDADATAAWWQQRSGRFIAKNVADPRHASDLDGQELPFFEFWAFSQTSLFANGEAAESEALNPGHEINVSARTKRVIAPIAVLGRQAKFDDTYQQILQPATRMQFLASLLAHEIGHTLGLPHALHFNARSQSYSQLGGDIIGTMGLFRVDGGRGRVQKFGPVHKATLPPLPVGESGVPAIRGGGWWRMALSPAAPRRTQWCRPSPQSFRGGSGAAPGALRALSPAAPGPTRYRRRRRR